MNPYRKKMRKIIATILLTVNLIAVLLHSAVSHYVFFEPLL